MIIFKFFIINYYEIIILFINHFSQSSPDNLFNMEQKMFQNQSKVLNPQFLQSRQNSIQINRLIKFIQNKKTPSFKRLKEILSNKEQNYDDPLNSLDNKNDKQKNNTLILNTNNIFVHRNRTQSSSPRMGQNGDNKFYKIFITKQEIMKLQQKEKNPLFSPNYNLQQKARSNLFPPLAHPKIKNHVVFRRQQEDQDPKIYQNIKNSKKIVEQHKQHKQTNTIKQQICEQQKSINQKSLRQKHIENLQLQRQQYNKSLQKLIEKAFKNKYKQKQKKKNLKEQNLTSQRNSIETEAKQSLQKDQESIYASKGKLVGNPNLKIKKDNRFKAEKNEFIHKLISPRSYWNQNGVNQSNYVSIQNQKNRKIIHTNRQAINQISSLKLKTQITGKSPEYQVASTRKQKDTLKLINDLEKSIMKPGITKQAKLIQSRKLGKLLDPQISSYINNLPKNNSSNQIQTNNKKKRHSSSKVKTLQSEQLPNIYKKTQTNWQLVGYDWKNTTQDIDQNIQLENYVENIVKNSDQSKFQQKGIKIKKKDK